MGPNQLFQRLVLLEQNDYWIGGQTWHGDLLSPLRIRHATTQPIRLLKTLHPRWSQNFRSDVLVYSSQSRAMPLKPTLMYTRTGIQLASRRPRCNHGGGQGPRHRETR